MPEVLIGSEAIAGGRITEYALRSSYRPMFRDVFVPKSRETTLRDRTLGAWLWSRRRAVVAGVAASALHGANWVDADIPIELVFRNSRPQRGLVVRNETLAADEITHVAGIPVTTPARTAFDLGRHLGRGRAVERLDALMRATPFSLEQVTLLADRHHRARGVRQLKSVLPLVDGGAASPRETWLRLLLVDAGFPAPTTQIPVHQDWRLIAILDMGWEDVKVAAEYDGDQHRTDRAQYVKDISRLRTLEQMGWVVIRVIGEDRRDDIVKRVSDALTRRGAPLCRRSQAAARTRTGRSRRSTAPTAARPGPRPRPTADATARRR
jgi:hypothetical protein